MKTATTVHAGVCAIVDNVKIHFLFISIAAVYAFALTRILYAIASW